MLCAVYRYSKLKREAMAIVLLTGKKDFLVTQIGIVSYVTLWYPGRHRMIPPHQEPHGQDKKPLARKVTSAESCKAGQILVCCVDGGKSCRSSLDS